MVAELKEMACQMLSSLNEEYQRYERCNKLIRGIEPVFPANTCQLANIFIQRGCNEHKALEYAEQAVKYLSANTSDWQTVRELIYMICVLNGEDNIPIRDWSKEALAIATRNAKG